MMMTAVASSLSDSLVTGSTPLPVLSLVSHEVRSCPHTHQLFLTLLYTFEGVRKELIMQTCLFGTSALNAVSETAPLQYLEL